MGLGLTEGPSWFVKKNKIFLTEYEMTTIQIKFQYKVNINVNIINIWIRELNNVQLWSINNSQVLKMMIYNTTIKTCNILHVRDSFFTDYKMLNKLRHNRIIYETNVQQFFMLPYVEGKVGIFVSNN